MKTTEHPLTLDHPVPAPHDHWLRVELNSGRPVARCLCPMTGADAATIITDACTLAIRSGLVASVTVPGPLVDLPDLTTKILTQTGLQPSRLEFAISARAIPRGDWDALLALSSLRDIDVGVLLTGVDVDTIEAIGRLPISALLLSGDLVRAMPASAAAIAQTRRIAKLAEIMALALVAPAIETEAQRAVLSGLGCEQGEGELFGT